MANDDFGHFGRRSIGRDDFDAMREQMAKERDAFFRLSGNDDFEGRPPYFNTPRSSFDLHPGGGIRREFGDIGARPTQRPHADDDLRSGHPHPHMHHPQHPQSGVQTDTIPISVIHERSAGGRHSPSPAKFSTAPGNNNSASGISGANNNTNSSYHNSSNPTGGSGKHKYSTAGRNTTELPAKSLSGGGDNSPRLERAHSEPPNKFQQRLNLAGNSGVSGGRPRPPKLYSTIPENSEGGAGASLGGAGRHSFSQTNPIKTSASAPSVPDSRETPVPPPRRSPPRAFNMNNGGAASDVGGGGGGGGGSASTTQTSGNVRHIPIFVEGRPEPIFNTNIHTPNQPAAAGRSSEHMSSSPEMPAFAKPSHFYPAGVQRIRSRDDSLPADSPDLSGSPSPFGGIGAGGWRAPPAGSGTAAGQAEPTTPQGPPPGPIPMGYLPVDSTQPVTVTEPSTPQGPPPGPIPMGYLPSQPPFPATTSGESADSGVTPSDEQSSSPAVNSAATSNEPQQQAIPLPCDPSLTRPSGGDPLPPAPPSSAWAGVTPQPVGAEPPSNTTQNTNNLANPTTQHPPTTTTSHQEPVVNVIPIKLADGHLQQPQSQENQQHQAKRASSPRMQTTNSRPVSQDFTTSGDQQPPAPTATVEETKDPRLVRLANIDHEADGLGARVDTFQGSKQDKEYLFLDDKLTKLLISADNIETDGISEIRQLRKESCSKINKLADLLERKASVSS